MKSLRRRLLVIAGLALIGLLTHSTYAGTGDEPHYVAIAHSIAFDRDLDLANNYNDVDWIVGGVPPEAHAMAGRDGKLRPVHDVGMPLLFAPYVGVINPVLLRAIPLLPSSLMDRLRVTPDTIYRHALSVGMIAVALILANELLLLLLSSGLSSTIAFGTTLLVVLSPPLSIHSIVFFSEMTSAALSLAAFRRLASDSGDRHAAVISGACTGLLFLVHSRNAGLVVGLTVLALLTAAQQRRARFAFVFVGALVVPLLIRTVINYQFWGTWLTTPHAVLAAPQGLASIATIGARRLAGLLIDQEFGLLIYAPIFLIAVFAIPFRAEQRRMAIAAAALIACYVIPILLPFTNIHGWTGGWSPAARFLVPIVPLLAILLAIGLSRAPRAVIYGAVAVQIVISAYFWQQPKNLWNDGDGIAAVCERGGATFCHALPSFVEPADLVRPPSTAMMPEQ